MSIAFSSSSPNWSMYSSRDFLEDLDRFLVPADDRPDPAEILRELQHFRVALAQLREPVLVRGLAELQAARVVAPVEQELDGLPAAVPPGAVWISAGQQRMRAGAHAFALRLVHPADDHGLDEAVDLHGDVRGRSSTIAQLGNGAARSSVTSTESDPQLRIALNRNKRQTIAHPRPLVSPLTLAFTVFRLVGRRSFPTAGRKDRLRRSA